MQLSCKSHSNSRPEEVVTVWRPSVAVNDDVTRSLK